jgi:hypothetical protein
MPYNNCSECPRNGTNKCPFLDCDLEIRENACPFVKLRLRPLPTDTDLNKQADRLMEKLARWGITKMPSEYFPHPQETQYSYSDFFHIAFAAKTPDNEARHLQAVLMSTAARADYMKEDITKARFYIDDKGAARAELPSEIHLRYP